MKNFALLIQEIDSSTKSTVKINALVKFLSEANEEDKKWLIALFTHRRPKRPVNTSLLRKWCAAEKNLPLWLFEDSYHIVGDLAETIGLLLGGNEEYSQKSLSEWIAFLVQLRNKEETEKEEAIKWAWQQLHKTEIFIFNKLITGGWRIGVSDKILHKALGKHLGRDEDEMAYLLSGNWDPLKTTYLELINSNESFDQAKPYPFYLSYSLKEDFFEKENANEWQAEWKWDGIRGQLIKRGDTISLWSRGEELINDAFPEIVNLANQFKVDIVLDGEIMAFEDGAPLPFQVLQKRIGRKKAGKTLIKNAPVAFMAYDVLEYQLVDIRAKALSERRRILNDFHEYNAHSKLGISPIIEFQSWNELEKVRKDSRAQKAEGLMLKRKNANYKSGRKKGDSWKWKLDPLTLDLVMIYAQRGHGRRANLYTDFTFAAKKGNELITLTKAYSGLTDKEFAAINSFIKKNTIERFGPVRSVNATQVFEIAFEGINKSTRNKSGYALRFPRIKRWRTDKPLEEINTIEDVAAMYDEFLGD